MEIKIELTERELKKLVTNYFESKLNVTIDENKLDIFVKSKQNYRSEWEKAEFKATYINHTEDL